MIKFLDLHKINERFRSELDAAAKRVLDRGWYLLGQEIEAFEREFAAYCGVKHAIGCANGLDALKLIVQAYGFGPGDEIIAPANTYIASLIAISAKKPAMPLNDKLMAQRPILALAAVVTPPAASAPLWETALSPGTSVGPIQPALTPMKP